MDQKYTVPLDQAAIEEWFQKYPELKTFIGAGTISLKMARSILGVDRYLMYDIFCKLVQVGAIFPCGNNNFRATKQLLEYLHDGGSENE